MDNSVIAKSGWLLKKSNDKSARWSKQWVELYRDGHLKVYESDHSPNAEDVIFMPSECLSIKTGFNCMLDTNSAKSESIQPPINHSAQCIFTVTASASKIWVFCGESLDDMRAWQLALEQARLVIISPVVNHHQAMMVNSLSSRFHPLSLNSPPAGFYHPYSFPSSLPFTSTPTYHSIFSAPNAFTDSSSLNTLVTPSSAYHHPHVQHFTGFPPSTLPQPSSQPYPPPPPLSTQTTLSYPYYHNLQNLYQRGGVPGHSSAPGISAFSLPSTASGHQPRPTVPMSPLATPLPISYPRPEGHGPDLTLSMMAAGGLGNMMWGPRVWW